MTFNYGKKVISTSKNPTHVQVFCNTQSFPYPQNVKFTIELYNACAACAASEELIEYHPAFALDKEYDDNKNFIKRTIRKEQIDAFEAFLKEENIPTLLIEKILYDLQWLAEDSFNNYNPPYDKRFEDVVVEYVR